MNDTVKYQVEVAGIREAPSTQTFIVSVTVIPDQISLPVAASEEVLSISFGGAMTPFHAVAPVTVMFVSMESDPVIYELSLTSEIMFTVVPLRSRVDPAGIVVPVKVTAPVCVSVPPVRVRGAEAEVKTPVSEEIFPTLSVTLIM